LERETRLNNRSKDNTEFATNIGRLMISSKTIAAYSKNRTKPINRQLPASHLVVVMGTHSNEVNLQT